MTILEVVEQLRSEPKIYMGVMPQSTFANLLGRIEKRIAKQETIKDFFAKFNYVGEYNEWRKGDIIIAQRQRLPMAIYR